MSQYERQLNCWRNVEHHDAIGSIKYACTQYTADRCLMRILALALAPSTFTYVFVYLPQFNGT